MPNGAGRGPVNGAGDEQAFEEGELTGAELLVALARLDAEAAAAYSATAEIIGAALYLASDASSFTTGTVLTVVV